jgi:hypothetical protein
MYIKLFENYDSSLKKISSKEELKKFIKENDLDWDYLFFDDYTKKYGTLYVTKDCIGFFVKNGRVTYSIDSKSKPYQIEKIEKLLKHEGIDITKY